MGSGVFRQSMKDHDYAPKNGDIENYIHFANHFFGTRLNKVDLILSSNYTIILLVLLN